MELTTRTNGKSFWEKKEGVAGMIIIAVLLSLIGWGFITILPVLLTLVHDTIMLVVMGFILFVLAVIILNTRNQIAFMALLQVMSRWFAEFVTHIDPVAILEDHIERLGKNLKKMSQKLDLLRGQEVELRRKIAKNESDKQACLMTAQAAQVKLSKIDKGTKEYYEVEKAMKLKANHAQRLESSNTRLTDTLNKITSLSGTMERIYQHSDFIFLNTKSDIEIIKEERQALRTGHSAFKSALAILEGDADQGAMYDMALEGIHTQMGNQIGEIERFFDRSGSFLTSMDIEKEVFDEKGLKLLEEFTKNEDKLLIPQINKNALNLNNTVNTKQPVAVSSTSTSKYIS